MKKGLVAIDIQQGFKDPCWGKRNNPEAEQNMAQIFDLWRSQKAPVFNIQHLSKEDSSPLRPNQAGADFMNFAIPHCGETLITKTVNSSFIGTDLENLLKSMSITDLLLMGFTSDHCVSTTARMAANLGFNVFIGAGATVTFDRKTMDGKNIQAEVVHEVSLASLRGEFATILTQAQSLRFFEEV